VKLSPDGSSAHTDGCPSGTAEVVLSGELDIATLEDAQRRVIAAEAGEPPMLVLDLSGLTFVDSSGVRLALLADERARAAGRRFAVRLGTGPAMRVFQALGLVGKLDVLAAEAGDGAAHDRSAP
jgi:anti-sigma B factor antagonist